MIIIKIWVIIFAIILVYTFCKRNVYFKPVTAVLIDSKGVVSVPIKPNSRFFSRLPKYNGLVCLGADFYAYYYRPSESDASGFSLKFGNFSFESPIIIFRIKRNRFVSVDYSDRVLNDIISKFIKEN